MRLPVWGHHHWWIERFQRFGCYSCVRENAPVVAVLLRQANRRCRSLQEPTTVWALVMQAMRRVGFESLTARHKGRGQTGPGLTALLAALGEPRECAWLAAGDVA